MKHDDGKFESSTCTTALGDMLEILIPLSLLDEDTKRLGKALLMFDFKLNMNQIRLVQSLVEGKTNNEIAKELGNCGERSVGKLLEDIFLKMKVKNRTLVAVIGTRYGL